MFELKGHKAIIKGLHTICENRVVLLSDDENDLLYTGSNEYGNRILGSIVSEDDEKGFLRYFHVLITDKLFYSFLNKETTFSRVLSEVENFFAVDFSYDGKEMDHALLSLQDIPEEYRPLTNSYCPDFAFEPTFQYAASLKGKESDLHKALPEDLNSVNQNFSQFLKNSTAFMYDMRLERVLYVEALKAGSFQINFRIDIVDKAQISFLPTPTNQIKLFLKSFTDYVFNELPQEADHLFKNDLIESKNFKKLENEFSLLFESINVKFPKGVEQKLIDMISYSVEPLKEIKYNRSFDRIEISNLSSKGEKIPIAVFDDKFIPAVENKFHKIEQEVKPPEIKFDDFPQEYNILVYQLNRESGNGGAYLQIGDVRTKVAIHAKGKDNFSNTQLTKSLDKEQFILVNGISKKVDEVITEIVIQF